MKNSMFPSSCGGFVPSSSILSSGVRGCGLRCSGSSVPKINDSLHPLILNQCCPLRFSDQDTTSSIEPRADLRLARRHCFESLLGDCLGATLLSSMCFQKTALGLLLDLVMVGFEEGHRVRFQVAWRRVGNVRCGDSPVCVGKVSRSILQDRLGI